MLLLLFAIILLMYLSHKLLTINWNYFDQKGIPYMKPTIIVGSRWDLILQNKSMPDVVQEWYESFKNDKVSGMFEFSKPAYIVRDPELIKKLTVKDFDYFVDHISFPGEDVDSFCGRALFILRGQKWKDMRATLSPVFTGSKMRQMFQLISTVGHQVGKTLKTQIKNGEQSSFEFKELARKFTVDVIATCTFGLEVNSFTNPKNDFNRIASKVGFASITAILKFAGFAIMPEVMRKLKLRIFNEETITFFRRTILETMKIREQQGIVRDDMINLLMQAKKGNLNYEKENDSELVVEGFATVQESHVGRKKVYKKWDDDDLVAQCLNFFLAGFEAVSRTMSFVAYELVVNPDVQRKLHDEIEEVNENLNGNKISYEDVQGMKYMDQVVCETLRKWPISKIDRVCVKDYNIEYDDKKFFIEKGKHFYVPVYGIHHDERYFKDPSKFDPERFSVENRGAIEFGTFLPFGIGPRNCIGSRFALIEMKTVIYYLLLNFEFVATERTQIPLKLAKNPVMMKPERGVWVELKPKN